MTRAASQTTRTSSPSTDPTIQQNLDSAPCLGIALDTRGPRMPHGPLTIGTSALGYLPQIMRIAVRACDPLKGTLRCPNQERVCLVSSGADIRGFSPVSSRG